MKICEGKFLILKSIDDIWPLIIDKYFMCLHFIYDDKNFITNLNMKSSEEIAYLIENSNIHLGLMFKRSLSGKKAFIKTVDHDA
jgi:hypothetical protein